MALRSVASWILVANKPSFPKVPGKHKLESLVLPERGFGPSRERIGTLPTKAVLVYSPGLEKKLESKLGLVAHRTLNRFLLQSIRTYVDKRERLLVTRLPIGAPVTAMTVEELGSLGVTQFLILGVAGGLDPALSLGDLVLCTKAVRDEGTSHHYLPDSVYAYPDRKMTGSLQKIIEQLGIAYSMGPTWTIDAPYRETLKEVRTYRNAGVLTVEMEASALFAAAKRRGAEAAAVFAVSDTLADEGWSGVTRDRARPYSKFARIASSFADFI
jgi:uridine phosphorylase